MREVSQSAARSSDEPTDPSLWLDQHGDALYNFALNRLHSHELAEEAVQETLVSAFRKAKEFRAEAKERTWLFSILRNKISDMLRDQWKSRRQISLDDEANPEGRIFDRNGKLRSDAFGNARCELESRELHDIIMHCVQKLPRNQATIFVLKILQDKNSEEICQDLQISTTNYWTRLHRARLAIANCVALHWPMDN
jgi:RNA polymerase sigma-70 factor (TIGR02943 family)